jgi:hypothetical protein
MENMMSENKEIFLAIEKARGSGFEKLEKNGKNPHIGSKYSTLLDVFNACKKPLEENGVHISFTTDAIVVDNRVENLLVCRLLHLESGEMLESKVSCLDDTKKGSQAIGSGISYMRRYLLQSMLNLECDPETDDDGNATTVQENKNTKQDDVTVFTSPDTVEHPFKIVSPTGEVKAGKNTVEQLLEVFQTFVVDCDNKESLHRFWKQNKVAVSLIEEKDTNLYKQLRASFDEQGEKIKKNGKWS